jgi:hypothetical protein
LVAIQRLAIRPSNAAEPFQRNLALISVLYSGEQPEMTPPDEKSKKAKNRKKLEKRKNNTYEDKIN